MPFSDPFTMNLKDIGSVQEVFDSHFSTSDGLKPMVAIIEDEEGLSASVNFVVLDTSTVFARDTYPDIRNLDTMERLLLDRLPDELVLNQLHLVRIPASLIPAEKQLFPVLNLGRVNAVPRWQAKYVLKKT